MICQLQTLVRIVGGAHGSAESAPAPGGFTTSPAANTGAHVLVVCTIYCLVEVHIPMKRVVLILTCQP